MVQLRLLVFLAVLAGLPLALHAQLLGGYLPQQCAGSAKNAIAGASDGIVVGVAAIGVSVPIAGSDLNIGMDMADGTAALWVYLVRSEALDTVAVVPLIRILGSCTAPPIDGLDPGLGDFAGFQLVPLPASFVQGAALVNAVKANGDYQTWAVAHPDSAPSVVILATSDEEVLNFPAGTPFWAINWMSQDGSGAPFICFVHAQTAQTICLGEDIVSVDDQGQKGLFALSPNPAAAEFVISVPPAWVGRSVTVSAVDVTGREISLTRDQRLAMPQVFLSTQPLSPGIWFVRVSDGQTVSTLTLTIVH